MRRLAWIIDKPLARTRTRPALEVYRAVVKVRHACNRSSLVAVRGSDEETHASRQAHPPQEHRADRAGVHGWTAALCNAAPVISVGEQITISVGEQITLHSETLSEDRTVFVAVPASYRSGAERYPVLYLPPHSSSMVCTSAVSCVGFPFGSDDDGISICDCSWRFFSWWRRSRPIGRRGASTSTGSSSATRDRPQHRRRYATRTGEKGPPRHLSKSKDSDRAQGRGCALRWLCTFRKPQSFF